MKNKIWSSWFSSFKKSENKDIKYFDKEEYDNIKKDRDKWRKFFYDECEECFKYKQNYEEMKKNSEKWERYSQHYKKKSEEWERYAHQFEEKYENMKKKREEMKKYAKEWEKYAKEWRELCYDFNRSLKTGII